MTGSDEDRDPGSRAGDVLRFWRRLAPRFGLPASEALRAYRLSESDRTQVYQVVDGGFRAVVRWPRGSLLRIDPQAGEVARLSLLAAESGLAPRVLMWEQGALELDGQPVMVSEYVAQAPPTADWFRDNIRQAATLLARLHRDEDLSDLLETVGRGDARADCLAAARAAWADLDRRSAALSNRLITTEAQAARAELESHTRWFGAQIQPHVGAFQGKRVGVVHGDVNRYNWLVDDANRVYLVDWERAWLDDPALDVGMLLHWYIPPVLWPVFVQEYSVGGSVRPDPDALLTRARIRYPLHAVSVCLWRLEQAIVTGAADEADALAFVDAFLPDLRRLRAGTFGT